MAVMVELYEALKEARASEAAARAMAEDDTRFDKLATKIDSGFVEVPAQITMLKWMNCVLIGGVAALIIKTFYT
jgi:hypothetical protein